MAGVIIFDPDNPEVGLSTGDEVAVNTYLDIQNDTLYFTDGLNIYEWEGEATGLRKVFTWRSGEIRLPYPVNLGAALVEVEGAGIGAEGYTVSIGNQPGDALYNDVLFYAEYEGNDNDFAYTELSPFAEAGTFRSNTSETRIETSLPILDTSSLFLSGIDDPGSGVSFPLDAANETAWDASGKYMTAEFTFRFDTVPSSTAHDYQVMLVGDTDFNLVQLLFEWSAGNGVFMRAGFADSGNIINIDPDPVSGTDYFVVIEGDYTGGASNGVERVWFGTVGGGTATLVNTSTGLTAKDPTSLFTNNIFVGMGNSFTKNFPGRIDFTRITVSNTARYGTGSTINFPTNRYAQLPITGTTYDVTFRLYADNVLKHTQIVADNEPFRLPGGYLSNIYSVEIESAIPITRVSVAENIFELTEG